MSENTIIVRLRNQQEVVAHGAPAPISDEQRAETGVDYDPDADEN